MRWWGWLFVGCGALVLACGDDETAPADDGGGGAGATGGSPDGGAGGGAGGSGGMPMTIPPCGTGTDVWIDPASFPGSTGFTDTGTPETAWQVGTATQAQPYVQANISPVTGHAFFVFCAGPALSSITVFMNSVDGGAFPTIHIHEGAGSVFGAEVTPTMTNAVGGSWPLTPGETYVLEVANNPGSFF